LCGDAADLITELVDALRKIREQLNAARQGGYPNDLRVVDVREASLIARIALEKAGGQIND
jgi:hypothetical protein